MGRNEDEWGIAGLLHDIDVEITNADPYTHGPYSEKILKGKITDEMLDAIIMHNEMATGKERTTEFQHALAAGETITGLITATTLVYPDKKIACVKPKSVTKRMKQKAFAASVKRENIMECEKIGIPSERIRRTGSKCNERNRRYAGFVSNLDFQVSCKISAHLMI